jgi:hypothetical protein
MPPDDPACGLIACPTDTPCRDWATSITANRCAAIGQCKTASACSFLNLPAKTYCGLYQQMLDKAQVCDGLGNCSVPTVTCGADGECPVNPGVCCFTRLSSVTACLSNGQLCDPGSTAPALCDEAADCPPRYVCCFTGNIGVVKTVCAASCPPAPATQGGVQFQICNPNTPGECLSGTCQLGTEVFASPSYYCH